MAEVIEQESRRSCGVNVSGLFESHHAMLTRSIDIDHGLLRYLVGCGLFDNTQKQLIKKTLEDRVGKLLDWITQKCEKDLKNFDKFIDCLRETSQQHVANLLTVAPDSSHDHGLVDLPLSDDAVKHLDARVVELSRELEVSNELLDHLLAEHCITREHKETIKSRGGDNPNERVDALVDILRMRSEWCFKKFADVLVKVHQEHVAEILYKQGVDGLLKGDLEQWINHRFGYSSKVKIVNSDNPLHNPPKDNDGNPRSVRGLVLIGTYLHVIYSGDYNKVEVFDCENHCKKIKDIEVERLKSPSDMVGSSVTSQLFIIERYTGVIFRVDLKTAESDMFIETGYGGYAALSLVKDILLMTTSYSLQMWKYDDLSREIFKKVSFTEEWKGHNVWHAIESKKDSFFVSHGLYIGNSTVSEIDSEGRVIRELRNENQFDCGYLALGSAGRLFVVDRKNKRVVLFDEELAYERTVIDTEQLDRSLPYRLSYNEDNNRLAVGLRNGKVKLFEL